VGKRDRNKAAPNPQAADPVVSGPTMTELEIESIGSRLFVVGERGEWDVTLDIRVKGQKEYAQSCSVRLERGRGAFTNIKFRDEARMLRDNIQFALAQGDTPVYVRVPCRAIVVPEEYAAEHREKFPFFPNLTTAQVLIQGSDFQVLWKIPQSVPEMMPKWTWLQGDNHD
jgi:hypothetical protein